MWRRREPSQPEPEEERPAAPKPSTPPTSAPAAAPVSEATVAADDPYAQLENFFNEPIILEDPGSAPEASGPGTRPAAPPSPPSAAQSSPSDSGAAQVTEAIQRLEQFAQRLAARFEALEAQVRDGSAQTLESLRRLGERTGAELAMLDKRAVNLELTMARLRSTTEALELSLRKLPDMSSSGEAAPAPKPSTAPWAASSAEASPEASREAQVEAVGEAVPPVSPDALFTLEEEVPPSDWDEPPRDESDWP